MQKLNSPFLALAALAAFVFLAYTSMHIEQGYNHSIFEVLPKGKPYRTQDLSEMLRLWNDYSSHNLSYDLPEDHLN